MTAMLSERKKTSFQLSLKALKLVDDLSRELGVSRTAILEFSVRDFAEKQLLKADPTRPARTDRPAS